MVVAAGAYGAFLKFHRDLPFDRDMCGNNVGRDGARVAAIAESR
jgi:hypothetical protein